MPFLLQGGTASITIPAGQSIAIGALRSSIATLLVPLGLPGGPIGLTQNGTSTYGPYPAGATVSVSATNGVIEYVVGVSPVLTDSTYSPAAINATGPVKIPMGAAGTTLTNPLIQATNTVNSFTQEAIQNLSAGTSASADHIAYPDNNVNDLTGFVDMGMTSSGYSDSTYSITGQNEGYLFASAPSGSSKSGSLVIATDTTGLNNNIEFYVGGFNKIKALFSARILGVNGLFQIKEGLAMTAKAIVNNGATTSYTVPAKTSYVYLTTTAASLLVTLPAASASIDGLMITICPSAAVAAVTWASAGASVITTVLSFVANSPARLVYDHSALAWYPA